jgi:hypothetical protein
MQVTVAGGLGEQEVGSAMINFVPKTGDNMLKGVGADTWTGDWRFVRALYLHDTGLVVNPLTAEADMVGS